MNTYIAMLRGINVSGQKKIKMADLRAHLAELAFGNIRTYIQSGNIIFEHEETSASYLEDKIKQKILEKYGFEVPVLVKLSADFEHLLSHNPFLKDPAKETKRMYVTFLAEEPQAEGLAKLQTVDYAPEEYILEGKEIYFFSPLGYGRAKMNNSFFEQKLKVAATTRNWRTINKLLEMTHQKM